MAARQRHDDGAASLFTLELRRSTRSDEDDGPPYGGSGRFQPLRAAASPAAGAGVPDSPPHAASVNAAAAASKVDFMVVSLLSLPGKLDRRRDKANELAVTQPDRGPY